MDETPGATLGRLIVGFQVSQAIHVAAALGVPDLLAGGPRTSDELAAATDVHAGSLYRLLRALASVGVFHEEGGRRFSLTPMGALLRSDVPGSLRGWAMQPRAKFSDLNMLVAPAGRERTLDEWDALVTRAGFRPATATPSTSGLAVIEAAPSTPD